MFTSLSISLNEFLSIDYFLYNKKYSLIWKTKKHENSNESYLPYERANAP